MKKMRKVISLLLVLIMVFAMSTTAFAEEDQIVSKYSTAVRLVQRDTNMTADAKLIELSELFFIAKEDNFTSVDEIDTDVFFASAANRAAIQPVSKKLFEYEKRVRLLNKDLLVHENFDVKIHEVNISGNSAKVIASEYYEYVFSDMKDVTSSREILYTLDFINENGEWKISHISTNNELEKLVANVTTIDQLFTNVEVPISDPMVDKIHNEVSQHNNKLLSIENTKAANAYTLHWYSGVKAIEYALKYSNATKNNTSTENYNTNFKSYNPNDCQNFVSQCIWAGLAGTNTATAINGKKHPMITAAGREWWATSSSASTSWTYIPTFTSLIKNGGEGTIGLCGTVGSKGSIANGYAGDALQIYSAADGWYHTYMIVKAEGTTGSRTTNDFFVCAHTANRRNERLSAIVGSATNLRLIAIKGSYY